MEGAVRQEPLEFAGSTGARLAGVLHLPATPKGSLLLAHCFTCSKDLHTMTRLARGLAQGGYAVLRFDFTGLGESGGDFADTTVATNVGDLVRAATALLQRGYGPCGMVGHSLGGAAVLLAAARLRSVASVAVINAPSSPEHVRVHLAGAEEEILRDGEALVELAGRRFPIARAFLDDLDDHCQAEHVAALARPLLVVHAVDDDTVPVSEGEAIFAAARQPKAFVPLLGTDHLISRREHADQLGAILLDWFDRTR